jgi:hypothetical protein
VSSFSGWAVRDRGDPRAAAMRGTGGDRGLIPILAHFGLCDQLMNPPSNAPCGHRFQGMGELRGVVGVRILTAPTNPVLFTVLRRPGLYDGRLGGCATVHLVDCVKQFVKLDVQDMNRFYVEKPRNLDRHR